MKTLIISDVHIGDPRTRESEIIEMLDAESFDTLVINGDFIDAWVYDLKNVINNDLFVFIKKISKIKDVFWVFGNHDFFGNKTIDFCYSEFLTILDGCKKILFLHGHQVYFSENKGWLCRMLTKINCFLFGRYGRDIQSAFNKFFLYFAYTRHRRKKVMKKFKKFADVIIMGHTHIVEHIIEKDIELYDVGSISFCGSYAVLEEGSVTIKFLNKNGA